MRWIITGMAALALAGCGASDEERDVGGVTVGEARALNEAASMLDQQADNARAALDIRPDAAQR